MKFSRALALSLISLLLFLSLSAFGLVLTVKYTALSPKFVTSELDSLDMAVVAEEIISEQSSGDDFPPELMNVVINAIPRVEPLLKEQVSAATYSVYDYMLGKRPDPELAATLRSTVLSPGFMASLVDALDISALAAELSVEQLIENPPEELELIASYIDDVIANIAVELEPWIKEQIRNSAGPVVDYLLGESPSLNVVIPLTPVIEAGRDTLKQVWLASPPPEFAGLPPALLAQQFDEVFREVTAEIPATIEIDEELLGAELPAEITEALAEAEESLVTVREYIGHFQLGYILLIVFILLLIAGIILINRQVKGSARWIGAGFLAYGLPWYIATFVAKGIGKGQLAELDVPASIQGWLPQFVDSLLNPLVIFSLALLITGVVLIVASFFYKRHQLS
ncbi:hypothetical protein ACFLS8_02015 [Chloroflexota bacterium]